MIITGVADRSPKHLYRSVEDSYRFLRATSEIELLRAAVVKTESRLSEDGLRVESHLSPFEDCVRPDLADRLRRDRVALGAGATAEAAWLLRGSVDWCVRFVFAAMPTEEQSLFLEMAREAVQLRLSEVTFSGALDKVRAIQTSLLPDPLPPLAGFDLAARSVAAEIVGGDVFDVIPLGEEGLALAIADASGHGLAAALEARDVVVGLRMGTACALRPTSLIERLNEILFGKTLSSRFVSLVFGELGKDGSFHYINAGHPAPILVTEEGSRFLGGGDRVLGVARSARYRPAHATLPPGGTLVLYTDGVTECADRTGDEYGRERLAALCAGLRGLAAAELVKAVFDDVRRHAGAAGLADDASLLIVRRLGEAGEAGEVAERVPAGDLAPI